MSDLLNKLQAELSATNKKTSNLVAFDDLTVVYLGVENKPYYAKLKDNNGNAIKDEKGNDKRSATASGVLVTFSQVGTSKVIKVVLPKAYDFKLLSPYKVGGLGYDLKSSNMVFIQESGSVKLYE